MQRGVEGLEDRQEGRGAEVSGIGREVEDGERNLALGKFAFAQRDQLFGATDQRFDALGMGLHLAVVVAFRPTAEDDRPGRAVQFRNGDHDRGFDGHEACIGGLPPFHRLELGDVGGDVGNVEGLQRFRGSSRIAVGRAADEGKAGERNEGVDGHAVVATGEVAIDGRAHVEAVAEDGNDVEAALFEAAITPS